MDPFVAEAIQSCAGVLRAVHVVRLSRDGVIEACNDAFCENLGLDRQTIVGMPIRFVLVAADADRIETEVRVPGRRAEPMLVNFCDAQQLPYSLTCWLDVDERGATMVAEPPVRQDRRHQRRLLDVTRELAVLSRERARTVHQLREREGELGRSHMELGARAAELERRNSQLQRLASELILAEQRAREDVAKTLHDGLQQILFGALLKLDRLAKRTSTRPVDEKDLIARTRADVEESVRAARSLSVDLFSPVLHDGGLPAALAWLASRVQQQYGVTVELTAESDANPEDRDIRILLFESVRELLFNAVKHAQVERVAVELSCGPGDGVQIRVIDEGVGFDPALPFHDHRGPLGLGLFSIRERVELLGGQLTVYSAPGCGARFTLVAPRRTTTGAQRDPARWIAPVTTAPSAQRSATDGSDAPLRVLIADDHMIVRAGLRDLLAEHSELNVVGEATTGLEAIARVDTLRPDVILMDVSMPQMDGLEATRRIHEAYPHIRIVALSSHDHEDQRRLMREAGAVAYFTKGDATDRLLEFLIASQEERTRLDQ